MKANELMIGDWLRYKGQYNAFPFRVEQITKRKVGYHSEPCENKMYYLRLHECMPIPLTQEILERNGFSAQNDGYMGYISYHLDHKLGSCALGMRWYLKDNEGEISLNSAPYRIIIKYVHELQHTLRLCGIEKEIKL